MSERRSGYRRSTSGLIGAILVCLALIAGIWLLSRLQSAGNDVEATPTVDYAEELATARAEAPFDVLAPRPAPEGWRATSVDWEAAGPVRTWSLGFLTPEEQFVGLQQTNAETSEAVQAATPADQPGPPVQVAGQRWESLTSGGGETAFVLVLDDVTVVVTGTAPREQLVGFAASLSPE